MYILSSGRLAHGNYFSRPAEYHSRAYVQRPVAVPGVSVGTGRLYVGKTGFERFENIQRPVAARWCGEPEQRGRRAGQVQKLRRPERSHWKIPLRYTLFQLGRCTPLFGPGRTVHIVTY